MELADEVTREIDALAARLGPTRRIRTPIDDSFDDPIGKRDRYGEVCMVIRRPNGKLLVAIKTFYPPGAYRLPTGGIAHGERIADALTREAHEETSLELEVRRFLAHIAYLPSRRGAPPAFHTFAFLLDERGGTLGTLDVHEQISDWREVAVDELPRIAAFLDDLRDEGTRSIGGSWRAWGRFRAVVHRVVYEALTG